MADWTPEKQRWLEESCRASGVPLKVTDPNTIDKVFTLLGGYVARSEAAKVRQGLSSNGKVTGTKREVGQYGNTRPREDAHVRRARREETDGRLRAAKAELAEHARKLAALEATLDGQPHTPYRPTLTIVAEETTPAMPTKQIEAQPVDEGRARELIAQGYHIDSVASRTGVPAELLQHLVGKDGYRRGRA